MNRPAAQMQQPQRPPTPEALQAQENNQKILRAIQGGLQFLTDEVVTAPIKYADGIVDLKWLLHNLAGGVFGINLNPNQAQVPEAPGGRGRGLSEYDDGDPEGATKQ